MLPVTYSASSDARKETTLAISSGNPTRLRQDVLSTICLEIFTSLEMPDCSSVRCGYREEGKLTASNSLSI